MFRFECLNDGWIKSCTAYIKYLFGDSLKGKTVIDYAFGRGNWSIAFLKAGAKHVIAIDAAQDNVKRLSCYCSSNHINNISIIHGNILEQNFNLKGDLLWLYGILHHLVELNKPDGFLKKIKLLLKKDGLIYVYFYNKNSLRCPIVELCRKLHIYQNEQEFLNEHYLFLKCTKNRASDDLVAPYIKWWIASDVQNVLNKNGIYIKRHDIDFYEFCNKVENPEFYPHQLLCSLSKVLPISLRERGHKFSEEIKIILLLGEKLLEMFPEQKIRKKIAIGIYNSYFVPIDNSLDVKKAIIEVYLYMMRVLIYGDNSCKINKKLLSNYYKLTIDALKDKSKRRDTYHDFSNNIIGDYLIKNRIRL